VYSEILEIKDIYNKYKNELSYIPFREVNNFKIDNSVKQLGRCCVNNEEITIGISRLLFKDDQELKNTILHEMIHTIVGCCNHGMLWKQYATIVTKATGHEITRTGCVSSIIKKEMVGKAKYIVTCDKCNRKIYRYKKSKLVTESYYYLCECGGSFTVEEN